MSSAITERISPIYSEPPSDVPPPLKVAIGSSVKDLPVGAATTARKAHDLTVVELTEKHEADVRAHESRVAPLYQQAVIAQAKITSVQVKRVIIAIVNLASMLTGISLAVISLVTGDVRFAQAALFLCVTTYLSSSLLTSYNTERDSLQKAILAPNSGRPILSIPLYKPETDLEIEETRREAVTKIAQTKTLQELAACKYASKTLISFALLDKIAPINEEKRAAFYAKCIQLLKAHKKISHENERSIAIQPEFAKAQAELEKQFTAAKAAAA